MTTSDHVPPPPATWNFRPLRLYDDDERRILDLLERSFDRWPPWDTRRTQVDFLRWYAEGYTDRHGRARGMVNVAESESRTIAASIGFLHRVKVGDRVREGRQGGYGAVDPDFRRLGVNSAFGRWRYANYDFDLAWGFTQVEALIRTRRVRGTLPAANPLSVFVRVLDPLRAADDKKGARLQSRLGYSWLASQSLLRRRRGPANASWSVARVQSFDDRVDRFWRQAAEPFDFITERSAEYLNWRYRDPRAGEFTTLVAEQDGELIGFTALRQVGARGHIADLLALPGRMDVARSLIDEGVRVFREAGAGAVECTMMLHHPYADQLTRAGFVRLAQRSAVLTHKFGVTPNGIDLAELAFLEHPRAAIHVVEGDSDLI